MYSSENSDIHNIMSPWLSDREAHDEELTISFTSLGLLVLDEIRFPGQQPLTDVLGGSGAYASLDARLFLPPPLGRSLGWMLNIGNNFPEPTRRFFESWGATLIVKEQSGKPSTKGLLEYKDTTLGRAGSLCLVILSVMNQG
ncbi:hypothetical protein BDW71DRAFT_61623 [Aspergillus fruticulosus]